MKFVPRTLLGATLGLVLLCGPAQGASSKTVSGPDIPLTEWMQEYEAWDAYARELSRRELSPEASLEHADAVIRAGNPQQALSILASAGVFSDSSLEGHRLWLRARGLRHLGRFEEAVLGFAQAASMLGRDSAVSRMRSEPGLDRLLESVWIRLFWNNLAPGDSGLSQARTTVLARIMDLATAAWPDEHFWKSTREIWPVRPISSPLSLADNRRERETVAKGLTALSLGLWDKSREYFSALPDQQSSRFWLTLIKSVQHPGPSSGQSPFLDAFAPFITKELWVFAGPDVPSWNAFISSLQALDPEAGLRLIRKEAQSALLGPTMRESLDVLEQAFILLARGGRSDTAALPGKAPLPLQAASMLLRGEVPETSDARTYGLLCALVNAGGFTSYPAAQIPVPFRYNDVPNKTSLDLVGNYARLVNKAGDDRDAAAKLAFLFPGTPGAVDSLMFLAGEAHSAGDKDRSWAYLNRIQAEELGGKRKTEYMLARAGLEMELGREDDAFATYKKVMAVDSSRVPADRKLKLAAMAQQKGAWKWAQTILEELNENRSALPRPLQAELLFWIGEGAQYQGDEAGALDAYLHLGWEYMDQNIWAVTAMYRAGLIYENQGKYATAKKVFETVLKHSDRKSQKKAATDRIRNVEAKMRKAESSGGSRALF
ncbi:MAG TPA: hypothetical protein VJ934_07595 [Desulfomicrobiaceae bacterium]|nr:hypothetical protein [Desulfomicrobiaceae bacterium]